MRWSCHRAIPKIGSATMPMWKPSPCNGHEPMKKHWEPLFVTFQQPSEHWQLALKRGLDLISYRADRRARNLPSRSRDVLALAMLNLPRMSGLGHAIWVTVTGSMSSLSVRNHLPGCCVFKIHLVNS